MGGEYAHYSTDLTHVLPINGRFTTRQEQVYNAVLHILYNAQQLLRPRLSFEEYHQAVVEWVEAERA